MRWPRAILLVRVTGLMDVTGSGLGRSSGKGVLRQWLHRRRTSRFLKICSQLSFPKIACRTWKNGNLMMARMAGFKIVCVQTE